MYTQGTVNTDILVFAQRDHIGTVPGTVDK